MTLIEEYGKLVERGYEICELYIRSASDSVSERVVYSEDDIEEAVSMHSDKEVTTVSLGIFDDHPGNASRVICEMILA